MDLVKRTDLMKVPFSKLGIVKGFNVRQDMGDISALAASIEQVGLKNALRGWKNGDTYMITDGHRRYEALKLLAGKGVNVLAPFIVEPKAYNDEDRTLDMLTTNDGKNLNLLEESDVYKRLLGYGWDAAEIAKKSGKSQTHISNCLLLQSASTNLKKEIYSGKVAASTVIEMLKKESPAEVEEKVEKLFLRTKLRSESLVSISRRLRIKRSQYTRRKLWMRSQGRIIVLWKVKLQSRFWFSWNRLLPTEKDRSRMKI